MMLIDRAQLEERHPLIAIDDRGPGDVSVRRNFVPVWAVIGQLKATGWDWDEAQEAYELAKEEVRAVLAYYGDASIYIDARLAETSGNW
jgi:uncharacterized protein (DUF433 family)